MRAEVALMCIAVGLYIYDSAQWLYSNEGLLIPARRKWIVGFGTDRVRWKGKELLIPNPLFPNRPLFKLAWNIRAVDASSFVNWDERTNLFFPLGLFAWGMAAGLFLLLPIGLFTRAGDNAILAGVILLYFCIIASLVWLGLNRSRYELTRKGLVGIALESLLCSPFALNLVRKISASMAIEEDLVSAARSLQNPIDWTMTQSALLSRLDEDIEDSEGDEEEQLKGYRKELVHQDSDVGH